MAKETKKIIEDLEKCKALSKIDLFEEYSNFRSKKETIAVKFQV